MVKPLHAEHLEILGAVRRGRIGIGFVKGIGHADAFDRLLGDTVHHNRRRNTSGLQKGRHNVDDMVELPANAAFLLDIAGQEIAMPWRVPPKKDGTCLVHLYGVSKAQAQGTAK